MSPTLHASLNVFVTCRGGSVLHVAAKERGADVCTFAHADLCPMPLSKAQAVGMGRLYKAEGRFRLKESCVVRWTCLWAFVKIAPKEARLPWKPVPRRLREDMRNQELNSFAESCVTRDRSPTKMPVGQGHSVPPMSR